MNIEALHKLYIAHFLVDTDTRRIRKNTIFFALKGENFNGNNYALEAIEKGAAYAVVDEYEGVFNSKIIAVSNVLKTLQQLANYHRLFLNIPIIGITGSNGKTTTKELISTVLSKKYNVAFTQGNLNNHIGVPLTLLSMNFNTQVGVVEMGANHHNEIAFLSMIAAPDFGYITNFGKAHLEGFGSLEGVIEAKSELYDYLISNEKKIFVNPNDKIQLEKTQKADRILFDEDVSFYDMNPLLSVSFDNLVIKSNLIGNYNFDNIAIAITIGLYFDISIENIKTAIESYEPNNNRSQIIQKKNNQIILDAYNANPSSMKAALENFDLYPATSKILILGDMFELGEESLKEHQKIANIAANYNFKEIYLVGASFSKTKIKSSKFLNFDDFKLFFQKQSFANQTFLIKGSRGMALERLLEYID